MISGIVNADFEPIIPLSVCGSDGKIYTKTRSWTQAFMDSFHCLQA